ncbi:MAG TPA: VanZ family protein [Burkholderiales bacterium]|nr:VanZ family protein [Burkholderiales bacterium]
MSASFRLRAAWLAIAWALVALVIYLSVTPRPVEIPVDEGDKLGHLLAYGTVMLWFAQVYEDRARWRVMLGLVLLGIALEFVQRWTGYRTFDVWDMAADAAGVLIGIVLAPPRLPNMMYITERVLRLRTARRP